MKILIVGSGGHARVIAGILQAAEGVEPIGCVSRGSLPGSGDVLGLPVLGDDGDVSDIAHDGVVLAIGDNRDRKRIYALYTGNGEIPVSAVHPSAIIAPDAVIEPGCMVCAGVVVNPGCRIKGDSILNTGCTVDHDCVVGPHAHIGPGVNLAGNVTVEEGAFVGIGASVIQGMTIGAWATVGAGAAVVTHISPLATAVGVPARELPSNTGQPADA